MIRQVVAIFLLFSLFSCQTRVPAFEIYQEARFSIPAGMTQLATHHFFVRDIPGFLEAHLEERKIELDAITELYAGKGRFVSIDFDYNFGILYDVSIWVFNKGEYENRIEIYYRNEVLQRHNGELKLLSTGQDVREILINDSYDMAIELRFKNVTTQSVDCNLVFSYVAYID